MIITLLTDFGTQDYFVGAMKGVILSTNPTAQIVDLTHDIPPQDIHAGAFNLLAVYKDFPRGTIHVAVVDPEVGSNRRPILIECAHQIFVGPDNGLFSWICEREGNWRAHHLTNQEFLRHPTSKTFHGRDVFAPVAAWLSKSWQSSAFGDPVEDFVRFALPKPKINGNTIKAVVLKVDNFGNLMTNLKAEDAPALVANDGKFAIRVGNAEV